MSSLSKTTKLKQDQLRVSIPSHHLQAKCRRFAAHCDRSRTVSRPTAPTSWATSGRGRMWRVRPDQEDEEDERREEEEPKAKRAASCGVSGPRSVSFLGEQT
ncbi:unnamed protein product [Ixodes pacificus]